MFGQLLPEHIKSLFLAISITIKGFLIFVLPFIVFSFAFYSFSQLKGGVIVFTILLLILICISNFTAVMSTYFIGINFAELIIANQTNIQPSKAELEPLFTINFPSLFSNALGLLLGAALGVYSSSYNINSLNNIAAYCSNISNKFLNKVFIPLLPIFILGFMLKIEYEGSLGTLFKNFLPLLLLIIIVQYTYMFILYFIVNKYNTKNTITAMINIVPAAIVGFSTMSSVASMPVLSECARKNTKDENLIKSIISSISNTHMLGDALAIPLIAILLYKIEHNTHPSLLYYLFFAFSYVLAKFAAAGVPGGTIIIMIPVLESHLQFTPEMSGLILTIYILFDPFCTMGNIFGNGAFAMYFEKLWKIFRKL